MSELARWREHDGGVHLMVSRHSTVAMTKLGAMNAAGQCHPFGASTKGYVRGEDGDVVMLKPLRRAITDSDRLYDVIRGTQPRTTDSPTG